MLIDEALSQVCSLFFLSMVIAYFSIHFLSTEARFTRSIDID